MKDDLRHEVQSQKSRAKRGGSEVDTQNRQPEDGWTFLGVDDFLDNGEIEALDREMERAAEESAMHIDHPDRRPVADPAVSDEAAVVEDDGSVPIARFDDEQPEVGEDEPSSDEHEPEIDEILESQNFLFGDDDTDQRDSDD